MLTAYGEIDSVYRHRELSISWRNYSALCTWLAADAVRSDRDAGCRRPNSNMFDILHIHGEEVSTF